MGSFLVSSRVYGYKWTLISPLPINLTLACCHRPLFRTRSRRISILENTSDACWARKVQLPAPFYNMSDPNRIIKEDYFSLKVNPSRFISRNNISVGIDMIWSRDVNILNENKIPNCSAFSKSLHKIQSLKIMVSFWHLYFNSITE
jgi:hypothetical protein